MRSKVLLPFLLFLAFIGMENTTAQVLGGDVDYFLTDQNTVDIQLKVYVRNDVNVLDKVYLKLESQVSSANDNMQLSYDSKTDITPICQNFCQNQNNPNCDFTLNITEVIYKGSYDFREKFNSSDCNIEFSWSSYTYYESRYETIIFSGNFNRCNIGKNSSPVFSQKPTHVIPGSQIYSYDHSAIDEDGDSLYYSLVNSIGRNKVARSYANGLGAQSPFYYSGFPKVDASFPSGFNFDQQHGLIQFVPTKFQTAQLAVKVEEFRNGLKIGEKTRDVQHTVFLSSNKTPYISGINGGLKTTITTCTDIETCFELEISDADKNDVLSITTDHNLPNASIVLDEQAKTKTLKVCFTPNSNHIGNNFYFKIHATDNGCDISHAFDRIIDISVAPTIPIKSTSTISGCGKITFQGKPIDNKSSDYEYQWEVDGLTASSDNKFTKTFDIRGEHFYQLTLTNKSTGCQSSLSRKFLVPKMPTAEAGEDLTVCKGETISLNAKGGVSYEWTGGTDPNIDYHQAEIKLKIDKSQKFQVDVTDKYGCTSIDFIEVKVHEIQTEATALENIVCAGSQAQIELKGAIDYVWRDGGHVESPSADIAATAFVDIVDDTKIIVLAVDENQCQSELEVNITADKDCVWPGDANGDAVVNNYDILYMGLAYNESGPKPIEQRTNFEFKALSTPNWDKDFNSQRNFKHADANGDGRVSRNDLGVFDLHYGRTIQLTSATGKNDKGSLRFKSNKDSVKFGDTVEIEVSIGTAKDQVADLHGVAFTITYDEYIKNGDVDFITTNSWLRGESKTIEVVKVFNNTNSDPAKPKSQIEVGISRTDKRGISGWGIIGRLRFVVTDNVDLGKPGSINFNVHNAMAIKSNMKTAPIEQSGIELPIYYKDDFESGIQNPSLGQVSVYPNPSTGIVNIVVPKEALGGSLEVINTLGQTILSIKASKEFETIDLSVHPGQYIIRLSNELGQSTRKLVID